MPKWKCYRCGHVFDQDTPPDICSNCHAEVSFWIDWTEAKTPLDEPVKSFMEGELLTMDSNNSVWDAAKLMKEHHAGNVFVTQNNVPVGIVTERDVLYKVVAEDLPVAHVLLRKVMSSPLVTISEDEPVSRAFEMMEKGGFRRLLVTRDGKAIGSVTQYGLAAAALKPPTQNA